MDSKFQSAGGPFLSSDGARDMEFFGVWDLGYCGWLKATDHTQNCEFFSIDYGSTISILFGNSFVFCLVSIATQRLESLAALDLGVKSMGSNFVSSVGIGGVIHSKKCTARTKQKHRDM